jgi:hypothetical protein
MRASSDENVLRQDDVQTCESFMTKKPGKYTDFKPDSKGYDEDSAQYEAVFNLEGWFVSDIPRPQEMMMALLAPLAPFLKRKARYWAHRDENDESGPRTIVSTDALECVTSERGMRSYSFGSKRYNVDVDEGRRHGEAMAPPAAGLFIDMPVLKSLDARGFSTIAYTKSVFAEMDRQGTCFYALANADLAEENRFGTLYSVYIIGDISTDRMIRYNDWFDILNTTQDRVHGVNWGNFLGPKLASKLRKSIVDEFNALADDYDGSPQHAEWLPNGSVYFLLNDDPRHNYDRWLHPPNNFDDCAYTRSGVWLARQFRLAGLM